MMRYCDNCAMLDRDLRDAHDDIDELHAELAAANADFDQLAQLVARMHWDAFAAYLATMVMPPPVGWFGARHEALGWHLAAQEFARAMKLQTAGNGKTPEKS